jgi:2-C-methyl-D-erythritol 4-phosphate cytidylyltransferase
VGPQASSTGGPWAALVALVPAAGRGERFGGAVAKQFAQLAGRPVLAWTVARLLAAGVPRVTVALPPESLSPLPAGLPADARVLYVAGGASRQESVARCLASSPGPADALVLVHDGARPAVDPEDVRATVLAAVATGGAVLGRPVGDTLKRVLAERIVGTVDRGGLFGAETPQVFRRELLGRALDAARRDGFQGTDEAALVERLGDAAIAAVAALHPNPKLTTPAELELLAALVAVA